MLEAVAVSWSAAAVRHQRRGDLVGREHVLVRARPVGQQRARDGGLRLRVLRACRPVANRASTCAEV